jgi:hypothetical protein
MQSETKPQEGTSHPSFRFDALMLQLLLTEERIVTFRTINAAVFFPSVVLICFASIYGTYLLIGSSQATIALFNSSMSFREATILFAVVLPFFAAWIPIRFARRIISKKSAEQLASFLAKRRGNVTINWDDVETATLKGSKVVLDLKKGGFRAGWLRQVYYSKEEEAPSPPSSVLQLELLQELLSRKLGEGFEVI